MDIYDKSFVPLQFYGSGHNQTNSEPDLSPIVSVDSEGNSTSTHNRVTSSKSTLFGPNAQVNFLRIGVRVLISNDFYFHSIVRKQRSRRC